MNLQAITLQIKTMGAITANSDGKKLWGADNVVYFKSICATYKIHYKNYKNTTIYNEETVDINDGKNTFVVAAGATSTRSLEIEFFDKDGNKFFPYNWEYLTKLKGSSGGNGMLTVFADGTIRIYIANSMQEDAPTIYNNAMALVWDDVKEDIDNRKVTIAFNFE